MFKICVCWKYKFGLVVRLLDAHTMGKMSFVQHYDKIVPTAHQQLLLQSREAQQSVTAPTPQVSRVEVEDF